ncbi:hypothetical protein [Halopseudomonas salegens]|uniref:Lipoprotein n=1 Tax=Halopseudomonas salegens TaxID=1434072 RepID=A0A1H2GK36_9GAMM|nr:hypothetical protein [Halopseudomonas salegens]SDU19965.1 hypothetical protein SAMN05216210_2365 [Halopseudomonas salegens]
MTDSAPEGYNTKQVVALTAIVTIICTVLAMHFYGFLNHVSPADGLTVQEFRLVTSGDGDVLRSSPSDFVAECTDGLLVVHGVRHNSLSGVLLDDRERLLRCDREATLPQAPLPE